MQLFPPRLWPKIDEIARLRVENKLIHSIKEGRYDADFNQTTSALGTWARDYAKYFTLKVELAESLAEKLGSQDIEAQNYVAKYFFSVLPVLFPSAVASAGGNEKYKNFKKIMYIDSITNPILVSDGSRILREQLLVYLSDFPEDWIESIIEKVKSLENTDNTYYERLIEAKSDNFPF